MSGSERGSVSCTIRYLSTARDISSHAISVPHVTANHAISVPHSAQSHTLSPYRTSHSARRPHAY
eukprot:3936420-Rhodomonas_salina.1